MKFSIAEAKITPNIPVFQAGFSSRKHKSKGIMDDLFVKVALFTANETLVIISFDLQGGDRSFVDHLKQRLYDRFSLKKENILINFSHSHATVYVTGEDKELQRGYYSMAHGFSRKKYELETDEDVKYSNHIAEKTIEAVGKCYDHLRAGSLSIGRGSSDVAVSRRLIVDGKAVWAPNYDAHIDKDLFVLKVADENGELAGILFSYGCHPTAMGSDNYMVSAEFTGNARYRLEQKYGVPALFLQGCGGDLKPLRSADGDRFKSCTPDEMRQCGADLANDVIQILEKEKFTSINGMFAARMLNTRLYTHSIDQIQIEINATDSSLSDDERTYSLELLEAIRNGIDRQYLDIYISIWNLDENTCIIGIEGEVPTEYGLIIKKLFPGKQVMVLGYTNGTYTYIPTRSILQEGGYEALQYRSFHFRAPFIPEIEDIIVGQIVKANGNL